jgi:hypothetical protein
MVKKISASMAAHTVSSECSTISATTLTTINMQNTQCGGGSMYCPLCYRLDTDTAGGDVPLQITNCQYYQGVNLGTDYVLKYEFFNTGATYEATVSDGTINYKLMPGVSGSSHSTCMCYNGQLECDASTVLGSWLGPLQVSGTFSVFDYARLGSSLSVLDMTLLGSTLSLRSFARLGSSLSVLDFIHVGSSLSIRSMSRLGSALSVIDFVHLGASVSVRSVSRLGSSVSLLGLARLGSVFSLSVLDVAEMVRPCLSEVLPD